MTPTTKPHYVYNWTWKFWANNGGPIGYEWGQTYTGLGWRYCWIEPNATKDGKPMLLGCYSI